MTPTTPILSLASNPMGKIDAWNPESLASLWTVFSKCAESLENGRRLENLSWRLWNRELLYCCDDSIFLVEDMTDDGTTGATNTGVNTGANTHTHASALATPNNSVQTRHTLHPQKPPPEDLLKSLSALSVEEQSERTEGGARDKPPHTRGGDNHSLSSPPQLSSSISSDAFSDSDYDDVHDGVTDLVSRRVSTTHVDNQHRSALSSLHSGRSTTNRSNLASSASTPTLSTTTATPAASRISSPPTLRTLVNSNDTNSRPTIRRGNKSISDYRSLYRKRPSMKRKRLSPAKLNELMQLFRPVGQEVEYWQSLREERRKQRKEQRDEDQSEEHELSESSNSVCSQTAGVGSGSTNDTTHVMLPKEVLSKEDTKREKVGTEGKPLAMKDKGSSKDLLAKDSTAHIKSTLAPTFFARSRRSSSRHRDSFNREKPVLVAPRTAQQQQPKVSSLFRRNTSVSSGSGSSAAALNQSSASAVADSDSYEDDDESDFTDETDNDDVEEEEEEEETGPLSGPRDIAGAEPGSVGNLRRSDTSTSIVRGFSPSKTSVSFLGRSSEMAAGAGGVGTGAGGVAAAVNGASSPAVNGSSTAAAASAQYQQVPRQKQKMFFIESSPSESDGFGESMSKSDCSFSPLKMESKAGTAAVQTQGSATTHAHAVSKSSLADRSVDKSVKKHVSVQSPPKLDSTKYDDYYNDDDDDSDWDSVESDGSSVNEEPTFSREENLSSHNLVRPSLLSSMFLNNPDRLQEQIQQSKDKSRIFSKGMIPDESNSVSSKLGSMFSGQAKRVNTYTNLTEANYIVENGGLNSDGEDIARDNASVARSLGVKSAKSAGEKDSQRPSKNNSVADLSRFKGAGPTPATVLSATPVAVATHEPVYGSILPSDVVRHSMLASEMSQSVQKSLMNQSEMERRSLEALKRRHTSIDLKKMGERPEWKKEAEEPADFDYHARGW
ncbi:hypothetical protein CKK34_5660 [Yarrowia sp. E02]|nr:hypothetical protein CKK34_5660 [Yarrowia sp. E02]